MIYVLRFTIFSTAVANFSLFTFHFSLLFRIFAARTKQTIAVWRKRTVQSYFLRLPCWPLSGLGGAGRVLGRLLTPWRLRGMCLSFFFYKFGVFKNMYVFIWLRRVFVAACRISDLPCSTWPVNFLLVMACRPTSLTRDQRGPPALGAQSLSQGSPGLVCFCCIWRWSDTLGPPKLLFIFFTLLLLFSC